MASPEGSIGRRLGVWLAILVPVLALLGWADRRAVHRTGPVDEGRSADPNATDGEADDEGPRLIVGRVLVETGPEPTDVVAAEAGTCRIRPWKHGVQVADSVSCGADGEFFIELPAAAAQGVVAIEIEIPGRLRAVLDTRAPARSGRLPTVALGVGRTLEGRVVDDEGAGVGDVEVQAMPSPNLGEPEPWRTRTDSEGGFRFETLPPGPVSVRTSPPGYGVTVQEALAPSSGVWLVLSGLYDLKGQVEGPAEVVRRSRVRFEGSGVWPPREVVVEADGSFVLTRVPRGVYALEAIGEDARGRPFASGLSTDVTLPEGPLPTLKLEPARAIRVRVEGAGEGPLDGARVSLAPSDRLGLLPKFAYTEASGVARFEAVADGEYEVFAAAEGWLSAAAVRLGTGFTEDEPIVVTLERPRALVGRVVDVSGSPVEDAWIVVETDALRTPDAARAQSLLSRALEPASGSLGVTPGPVPQIPMFGDEPRGPVDTRSDAGGAFVIEGLAGAVYRVRAFHDAFAPSAEAVVDLSTPGPHTPVELVLSEGFALQGRVLDGNDRPIVEARVETSTGRSSVTDARGVFELGQVRGEQALVVRAVGHTPARRVVRVDEDVDIEIRLVPAEGRLQGRVEDGNGRPIEHAQVTAQPADGLSTTAVDWTDPRGLWSLEGLPQARFELGAAHDGYVDARSEIALGVSASEVVDFVLERGWMLELVVADRDRRAPLPGARVQAGGLATTTDPRGQAVLGPLSGPEATVWIEAAGYVPQTFTVERPVRGSAHAVLELVEGGGIEGSLTDYRGDPVPDVPVLLRDPDTGRELENTRTDAAGRWSFAGIREGSLRIEAEPPDPRRDELADVAQIEDVIHGRVTRDVLLRFDRR